MKNIPEKDKDRFRTNVFHADKGLTPSNRSEPAIFEHWQLVKPWWRKIAVATLAGVVITFLLCELVLRKWYQGSAIIRPASQQGPISPLAMMFGSSSISQALSNMIGTTTSLSGQLPSDAAEYTDTLQSYQFTTALIERHKLGPVLDSGSVHLARRLFLALRTRFGSSPSNFQDLNLWYWYQ